jgi:hypothetical protein
MSTVQRDTIWVRAERQVTADFSADADTIRSWVKGGAVETNRLVAELRVWAGQFDAALTAQERAGDAGGCEAPGRCDSTGAPSPALSTGPGEFTDREDVEGFTSPLEHSPGPATPEQRLATWLHLRHDLDVTAAEIFEVIR